ncbi:MAG: uracil-DNA glycosylase [Vicinamibacterales bacterium]|jgi:uracil-DNA glycosylase family 4|nr:uracil-DNA glycosylase [Vicinamibacterales bacterium]
MALSTVQRRIAACQECPRLRAYCARVAQDKRAAYRDEVYWGRPVPGFGDRRARLLVLGLAPAAHGANRTGRPFTGDRASDFLMTAMHETGFSNLPTSQHRRDGLKLTDAYITAVVRCAPPDNRPSQAEISSCHEHLQAEMTALTRLRAVVALGRVAFDGFWRLLAERGATPTPRPKFQHGLVCEPPGGPSVVASYHPSQRNTNTGRLTPAMLTEVFARARAILEG